MPSGSSVAIVTGAASGLGAATARRLAAAGRTVVVADRLGDLAAEVAAEIDGVAVETDVGDEDAVTAMVATATSHGELRSVVHCAGIGWADRLVRGDGSVHPLAGFEKVLRVNLVGTFNILRLCGAAMASNEADPDGVRGAMVLTASVAAMDGQTGQVAYAASKGAVVAMTLPAARDLSVLGVRVCTIVPGLMDTPLASTMPPKNRERLEASALLPKRFGRPEEFARLAFEILENPYLNAEVIRIDAGIRMGVK